MLTDIEINFISEAIGKINRGYWLIGKSVVEDDSGRSWMQFEFASSIAPTIKILIGGYWFNEDIVD